MDDRLAELSAKGDDLNAVVDFEMFRSDLERKRYSDHIFHAVARAGMMRGHEHPSI